VVEAGRPQRFNSLQPVLVVVEVDTVKPKRLTELHAKATEPCVDRFVAFSFRADWAVKPLKLTSSGELNPVISDVVATVVGPSFRLCTIRLPTRTGPSP
jgi:hypothetical protein